MLARGDAGHSNAHQCRMFVSAMKGFPANPWVSVYDDVNE